MPTSDNKAGSAGTPPLASDAPSAVVHIGAPKCGSSSLQAALSERPNMRRSDGRKLSYVSIDRSGRVESGLRLSTRARLSPYRFASSTTFSRDEDNIDLLGKASPAISRLVGSGTVPVLSAEGWINKARCFSASGLMSALGDRVHVVLYVRPPADWINSAWWQWGVWSGATLDQFVRHKIRDVSWSTHAQSWMALPGVSQVTVRLTGTDIVPVFFGDIGVTPPATARSNTALPPALMFHFLRNRERRGSAHAAETEFILGRHLKSDRRFTAPWVLTGAHLDHVFAKLGDMSADLRHLLNEADRAGMDADPRWWSKDPYAAREIAQASKWETRDALLDLTRDLCAAAGATEKDATAAHQQLVQVSDNVLLAQADAVITGLVARIVVRDRAQRLRSTATFGLTSG